MATNLEDMYVVFLRGEELAGHPELAERPFAACPTYSDARRLQRLLHGSDVQCVIRFFGSSGGGD